MKILVIIPAYNEEESVCGVVKSFENADMGDLTVDYVIINDCSTDATRKICAENGFNHINLPVNLGIGGGIQTGYKYAVENDYDIAIQMDGDGQHDPNYIKDIVVPIIKGEADMVIGSRFINKTGFQSSVMRRVGIIFLKWLIKLCCNVTINDTTSGFRATNKVLTKFYSNVYAQDYPEPEAIISAVVNGFRVREVPVIMHERQGGESSIRAFKTIYYMIKVSLAIIVTRLGSPKKRKTMNKEVK